VTLTGQFCAPPEPAAAAWTPRSAVPAAAGVADAAPTTSDDLAALAGRAQAGDEAAFAALVRASTNRLLNFLYRLIGHAQDAEDLAQETFVKAHRALDRYNPARPFLPWLFTIARRSALNHLRALRPVESLPDGVPAPDAPDPAEASATRDDHAQLWRTVRRLHPRYHEVLWLYYGEGFTAAEVATVMRTNALCVKVLLHRARRALLSELRAAESEPQPPAT
jgi:RNA polymerase sigma-70 factor (ECF subfamily)